jgi:hypothetical protein
MITLEVKGIKELNDMFTKLGELSEKHLDAAITSTAIEAASEMKILLTSSVVTNRLRSSVHHQTVRTKVFNYSDNLGKGFDGIFSIRLNDLEAAWGTNVEYAGEANERSRSRGYFEKSQNFAFDRLNYFLRKEMDKAMKEAKK